MVGANHRSRNPLRATVLPFALLAALLVSAVAGGVCLDPPGDVDGSGLTNVVDVQCVLVVALWDISGEVGPIPPCATAVGASGADANCDATVSVSDVQILISYALNVPLSLLLDADGDLCPDACASDFCGDGSCTGAEDCATCEADCGPCAGDCCSASAGLGCGDAGCEACVCGQDEFCCTTSFDELCANTAGTVCLGQCPCEPAGALTCAGGVLCAMQCDSQACLATCAAAIDPTAAPAAAAVVACAQAANCFDSGVPTEVEACIATSCPDESFVCAGGTLPDGCCDAGPVAGCGDTACEGCVCTIDSFCCDAGWDGLCAQYAAGFCAGACNCEGGAGNCFDVTNCLIGCTTTACADACYSDGLAGTYAPATNFSGCIEAQGCLDAPDQAAFDLCISENCAAEQDACAGFASIFPLGCCDVQPTGGCGDATCEACVCGADAFCCDTSWDSTCTAAAAADCGADCGCSPSTDACVPVVNCVLSCDNSFCVQQCLGFLAPDSAPGADALLGCLDANGCLAIVDPIEFDTCLTTQCSAELAVCNENSCCGASDSPGCVQADCESCVCAADPFCCETSWDGVCTQGAASDCGAECGCAVGDGTCIDVTNCALGCDPADAICIGNCVTAGAPGSGLPALAITACLNDSACLGLPTEEFFACLTTNCLGEYFACDQFAATGDCCADNESPGCAAQACTGCVCSLDDFCCGTSWDAGCVSLAEGACNGACECAAAGTANCLATANCWLGCSTTECENACFDDAAAASEVLANSLLTCLEVSACFNVTTQAQFDACLFANCATEAQTCVDDP